MTFGVQRAPVTIHRVSALSFYILGGSFSFSAHLPAHLRRTRPRWHRVGGRIALPIGLLSALSGMWMTQFYPNAPYDGLALYLIRLSVGSAMVYQSRRSAVGHCSYDALPTEGNLRAVRLRRRSAAILRKCLQDRIRRRCMSQWKGVDALADGEIERFDFH